MTACNSDQYGEELSKRLENISEQLTLLLRSPDVALRLRTAAGEAEWSAMQVLGHLVEMIPYWLGQCRVLIAAVEPPTFGRLPDAPERQAGPERGASGALEELLGMWHASVKTATDTIRQMSASDRSKKGLHVRRGEMTVADIVELFIVAHAEEHLAQVKAALQG
jgi:hypothetical protein